MTQQEAQEIEQKFQTMFQLELHRNIMSWDQELHQWHDLAMISLQHASPAGLGIRNEDFAGLLTPEKQGVTLKHVMILCNCLEKRSAHQMSMTVPAWAEALKLNAAVGQRWNEMVAPIHQRLQKEVKSQIRVPKMQLILPHAEA